MLDLRVGYASLGMGWVANLGGFLSAKEHPEFSAQSKKLACEEFAEAGGGLELGFRPCLEVSSGLWTMTKT